MKERLKRAFDVVHSWPKPIRYFMGFLCVIFGIAGLALPFLQGFLFLAIALVLFGLLEYEHIDKSIEQWNEYWNRKK